MNKDEEEKLIRELRRQIRFNRIMAIAMGVFMAGTALITWWGR